MPSKAMISAPDSQNPTVSDIPLYAVVENGQFYLLDVEDIPCPTLTDSGRDEVLNNYHTHAWLNDALTRHGIDTSWLDEV
jgi:hypothetical protein